MEQVESGYFRRPYPYHLDYYKMRWGGSYDPYFGNIYGPPNVVIGAPFFGGYYDGGYFNNGFNGGFQQPGPYRQPGPYQQPGPVAPYDVAPVPGP